MLIKSIDAKNAATSQQSAGDRAERQMQFYLNRRYGDAAHDVFLLNDLRIESHEHPNPDGTPGVAQIDHLLVHAFGMFIIESKSVSTEITVKTSPQSGEQWFRRSGRSHTGIPSPIEQARRQADLLRAFLQPHRAQFFGEVQPGLIGMTKRVVSGTAVGFINMPMQVIVAISDNGSIQQPSDAWSPTVGDFAASIRKADQVEGFVEQERKRHQSASKLRSKLDAQYGLWRMPVDTPRAVAEYLRDSHTPARRAIRCVTPRADDPTRAAVTPQSQSKQAASSSGAQSEPAVSREPTCKHCGSKSLTARYGKYGYFWTCQDCTKNTSMPLVCSQCGAGGCKGKGVRVRKEKHVYYRECTRCGLSECIWIQR